MDRKAFYDRIRTSLFGGRLTAAQVGGIETLMDAAVDYGLNDQRQFAYVLAGVYHETGRKMVPVREGFASTDAGARSAVAKLFAQKRISRNYAEPVNGVSYYGRGRIQNTHLANYQKLEKRFGQPFVTQPDLLLVDEIDAAVTIAGHAEGIWTGKKLSDYITPAKADYVEARRIVNGKDKAALIAGYAGKFEDALRTAEYGAAAPVPAPVPLPEPRPVEPEIIAAVPTACPTCGAPARQTAVVREAVAEKAASISPVEQVSKVRGGAIGVTQGAGLAAVIVGVLVSYDLLPVGLNTPEATAVIGVVLTYVLSLIQGAIKTYRAPPNAEVAK